jgi:thiol-disulfide isomerase/thioredoxin
MIALLKSLVLGCALLVVGTAQAQSLKPWTGGATPGLELADPDGKLHRLADYRGKTVLVNFWATWCAPCRAEMPSMERLRREMDGRPFVILAVNVGEGPRLAREFAQQLSLEFPILLDRESRVARAWRARLLPASYIVGPDGTIRYSVLGEVDWASAEVRRYLNTLMVKDTERAAR